MIFGFESFFNPNMESNNKTEAEITVRPTAFNVGDKVPDFKAPQPNGEILGLEDVKGKYTLIEFWASWCRPCRIENPNLVKVYHKHHDNGFNVIGVSLDRSKAAWERAIEQDNLPWEQISNLKFWQDPIAKQFMVRFIPQNYLVDEDGVVVAKNLRSAGLDRKLNELLKE